MPRHCCPQAKAAAAKAAAAKAAAKAAEVSSNSRQRSQCTTSEDSNHVSDVVATPYCLLVGECKSWCADTICFDIDNCKNGGDCSNCAACDCSKKCNPKAPDFPGNNGDDKCSGSSGGGGGGGQRVGGTTGGGGILRRQSAVCCVYSRGFHFTAKTLAAPLVLPTCFL